jgi:hypothetical protein
MSPKTLKLIPMIDFVEEMIEYAKESNNYIRAISLLSAYKEFLSSDIKESVFSGEDSYFLYFRKSTQKEHTEEDKYTFYNFGDSEFSITYRAYRSVNNNRRICLCTNYHLSKIEQLCGVGIEFYYDKVFGDI